jgi:hypothetical protein
MARTYTRSELRTRLEQICDIENDTHLSAAEKNAILDSAFAETYDVICSSGLGEKYVTYTDFNTVAGQLEYPISSNVSSSFYRLTNLYVKENNGTQLRQLQRVQPSEILDFRPPTAVVPIRAYYIPFVAKTSGDSDTFDGVNGWEEHLLMTAACAVKLKREEDYGVYARRKAELEKRIRDMGNIDLGEPIRVSRKRKATTSPWFFYNNTVNAYGIRGDKLELYYLQGYIPGS